MREVTPTRSAAIELADERKLMRQGYEFLDEKRMLLASEMLRQLRDYQERFDRLLTETKDAASALAAAVEPAPEAPVTPNNVRTLFLGLAMMSVAQTSGSAASGQAAVDPSPEAKACHAAFEKLLWTAVDIGLRMGNLMRLAREYRRTERRAKALEKVLLPEVEEAMKLIDEQLDTMEREEVIRTRWSSPSPDIRKGTGGVKAISRARSSSILRSLLGTVRA
jgi:V/A-type H+/Na+-transporting ATPase subunit D